MEHFVVTVLLLTLELVLEIGISLVKLVPALTHVFLAQAEAVLVWIAVATLALLGAHSLVLVVLWSFFECVRFWKSRADTF